MRRAFSSIAVVIVVAAPPLSAQGQQARPTPQQRDQRYQITTMERVLEGAVEHGAKVTRDRMQAVVPAEMLLSDNARVRGYRLEGYGLFFDVAVPMLEGSLTWSFRTLDQNNLGLESALDRPPIARREERRHQLRAGVEARRASGRAGLVERPGPAGRARRSDPDRFGCACSRSSTQHPGTRHPGTRHPAPGTASARADAILDDPVEAFRAEIRDALMNAMLDHGAALRLTPTDLFTIAARGSDDRSVLGPLRDDAQTIMITVSGGDLTAYLSGQIGRDEARQRMTVRVF